MKLAAMSRERSVAPALAPVKGALTVDATQVKVTRCQHQQHDAGKRERNACAHAEQSGEQVVVALGLHLGAQHQTGQQLGHSHQADGNAQPLGHIERKNIALLTVEAIIRDALFRSAMVSVAKHPEWYRQAPELAHLAVQTFFEGRVPGIHDSVNLSHLSAHVLLFSRRFGFKAKKGPRTSAGQSILKGGGGDSLILTI